jgi:glycosyltransferase involved in cell wall biosynthesis
MQRRIIVNDHNRTRLVHVSGNALLGTSGFSQQFFMEVLHLVRHGYDVSVLMFCHVKFIQKRHLIKKVRQQYNEKGIQLYIIPTFLIGRFMVEFLYYPIAWAVVAYFILLKGIKIFHIHELNYAFFFLPFKLFRPIQLFQDIHGVLIEEAIYNDKLKQGSILHFYLNHKERLALRLADAIFCVSHKMIDYYTAKHNLPPDRFQLTRTSFDPDIFKSFSFTLKEKAKERLGLKNKIVLLYMGHKKAWQLTGDVVNLFADLEKYLRHLKIIVLSDDTEGIRAAFADREISEDQYVIKFVPHDKVPLYSYAADAAIIIRDESIINKVASPMKFSEYLASGALVLVSPTVGDLPAIVIKYEVGLVLWKNSVDEVATFLRHYFSSDEKRMAVAERCRQIAQKEFSVDNTIRVFRVYYESRVKGR